MLISRFLHPAKGTITSAGLHYSSTHKPPSLEVS